MSWTTNNHKIAATFSGLGFRVTINETEIVELDNWKNLRFEVSDKSLLHPQLPSRDDLYRGWKEGTLNKLDPDHPFLCGFAACHNFEQIMHMQATATSYRLQRAAGSPLYRYEVGIEDSRLQLAPALHATVDLPLAAAVAVAGLPVINIDGNPGRRRYLFPDMTLEYLDNPTAAALLPVAQFFPRIYPRKPNLQLGLTHPQHPVVQGYNAAYHYASILGQLKQINKRLLIKDPFSNRRALIPENPSAKLENEVRDHFRIP